MRLRDRIATPEGKRRYVRALFATIADRYDFITVALSYGQDRRWKRRLVQLASPRTGTHALDLATGTGDIARELAGRGASVIGLDITLRMIEIARLKDRGAESPAPQQADNAGKPQQADNPGQPQETLKPRRDVARPFQGRGDRGTDVHNPRYLVGDMLALPFPSASFDLVTTGYGLRNVPDLTTAIDEIQRVLKPGGQLVSLDFNRPSNAIVRTAYLAYLTSVGAALGWTLHRDPDTYRYIPASIRQYPGAHAVARMLEDRGFRSARYYPVLGGLMAIHHAVRS